jgi:putative endonuclease
LGYTQHKGSAVEKLACDYLRQQGLTLLESNYRCRFGEIDLILREQDTIVFVEVRYRKANSLVTGAESVNASKQLKLIRSANCYLQQKRLGNNIAARIDVVAVTEQNREYQYDWIQNAIEAG